MCLCGIESPIVTVVDACGSEEVIKCEPTLNRCWQSTTVVRLFFVSLFRMFHFTFALFLLTFSACVSKLREFSFFMIYRFGS